MMGERYVSGAAAGMLSFLAPVRPLVICAMVFVAIDFVTGVIASRKRALRAGEPWGIESSKAWNTVAKLFFVMGGIVLAWMIDAWILPHMNLRMANLFTGFVCGVEFWSYLENAAEISDHPAFKTIKKLMKNRYDKRLEE